MAYYKPKDEREKRCMDCIFLKKRMEREHTVKIWFCSVCNIEIHKIPDDECKVLDENYS